MNWILGKTIEIRKVGFEDVQLCSQFKNDNNIILINTMPSTQQNCLIANTLSILREEQIINEALDNYEMKQKKVIIYGKNSTDNIVELKARQLINLGFTNIYVYYGGLFEWLLLQDVFGEQEFSTNIKVYDILKYKPEQIISVE